MLPCLRRTSRCSAARSGRTGRSALPSIGRASLPRCPDFSWRSRSIPCADDRVTAVSDPSPIRMACNGQAPAFARRNGKVGHPGLHSRRRQMQIKRTGHRENADRGVPGFVGGRSSDQLAPAIEINNCPGHFLALRISDLDRELSSLARQGLKAESPVFRIGPLHQFEQAGVNSRARADGPRRRRIAG